MSRIDERLEAMQVDTSEMTTEEKFTAVTGLTHYDEEIAANDWYVPGGAANVVEETEEDGEKTPETPVDPTPDPTPDPEEDPTPDPTPDPEEDPTPDPEEDPTPDPESEPDNGDNENPSEIEVQTEP